MSSDKFEINVTYKLFVNELYLVKLATVVEGDLKTSFSIATTSKCRGGHNFFPWITPLYLWSVPHNAKC